MQSGKQCAPPVITTIALSQLMHLGTSCTVNKHCYIAGTNEPKSAQHVKQAALYISGHGRSTTECSNLTEARWT